MVPPRESGLTSRITKSNGSYQQLMARMGWMRGIVPWFVLATMKMLWAVFMTVEMYFLSLQGHSEPGNVLLSQLERK